MKTKSREHAEVVQDRMQVIAQSNELVRHARNKLTSQEQNIIYFLMSKVKPNDKDFMRVYFTAQEFCEVCGLDADSGKNWQDIKASLKSLADKSAWGMGVDEHGRYETLIRWVDTYKIHPNSGRMEAVLSQSIKPFLLNLIGRGKYVQAELVIYLALKSVYSKRIYELLKSWIYMKPPRCYENHTTEYSLDELKELVAAKSYKLYGHFKTRVLDQAMKEINETSDIQASYEPMKREGRAVSHIRFSFSLKRDYYRARIAASQLLDSEHAEKPDAIHDEQLGLDV